MKNKKYNDKYYHRHYHEYRIWENQVGNNIYKKLKPQSIIDLGCGVGSYLEGAFKAGCEDIKGIEISYDDVQKYIVNSIFPYISYGDITENILIKEKFDCVLSIEVAEHIDPQKTDNFIKSLINCSKKHIILTAAPPGQRGTGHINLREKSFWIKAIEEKGAVYNEELVEQFKNKWKEFNVPKYILKNLMVFEIEKKER